MNSTKDKVLLKNIGIGILAPLLVVILWQVSAEFGWTNKAVLPSFSKVLATAVEIIADGKLQEHLAVSFIRVIKGFLIGAVSGILIGTIMGLSKGCKQFLGSLVGILRPIPMIAWIPIFILWFGIGELTKVAVITLGTFWSVLLNTIHGIQSVDPKLLEVAKVLKKDRITIIRSIVMPSALPAIFTGIRLGFGTAWSCVVAAEMIAATKGIGFMITYAREVSKPGELFVGVFTIGLVGLLLDVLIQKLEDRLIHWL